MHAIVMYFKRKCLLKKIFKLPTPWYLNVLLLQLSTSNYVYVYNVLLIYQIFIKCI